ncbi:cleavage and polyadenylation specificity factor subunit 2, partial [Phenoliferia sp. Uapishka_3]
MAPSGFGSTTITPLGGPFPSPSSYLLTIDGSNILLDCGSYDNSPSSPSSSPSSPSSRLQTREYLNKLKELAPTLNLVLLTHPLLSSLGLLPWLKARCGLRCPVYATLPTREMGRWAVEEWVEARSEEERNEARENKGKKGEKQVALSEKKGKGKARAKEVAVVAQMEVDDEAEDEEDRDPWDQVWKLSTTEIRDAFLSVSAVRWTQPVHLSGLLKGYTLVAHRAGHTLGGCIYTIRPSLSSSLSPASSSSSLLYAPVFNHIKEHHLDGAALLNGAKIDDLMRRMGVVVVGADRSLIINTKRVDRERALLDLINTTLNSGGSLLLPTDPSARVLELLVLLESHWTFANLGQRHPLCLISRTGKDVVGFVRSLTEWMGGQVGEEGGEKVLRFNNLRIYSSIAELNNAIPPHVPKLILTVPATLSHGYSRQLFVDFARNASNVVVLTGSGEEGTLARWLFGVWNEGQTETDKWGKGKVGRVVELGQTVELEMKRKVYLAGEELADYEEAIRLKAEKEAKHQAMLERSRRMAQADAESDSDSDGNASSSSNSDDEGGLSLSNSRRSKRSRGASEPAELDFEPSRPRKVGGFTGGAGAWDEFLDPTSVSGGGGQSFDIYVKGAFAKRAVVGGLERWRMFPVVERKRRVDAYGEAIDVEGWLKRGVDDEDEFTKSARLAREAGLVGKRIREEEEKVEEKVEPPHKYIVEQVDAHLLCSLFVVDMEGRTDGRAIKTILPQINPRKLVIVDGSPAAVADLAAACRSVPTLTDDIYTPDVSQCITIGEETKNFSVRLGDSIMASLKLSRVEDYDVAYISGVIHIDPESDIPVLERASLTNAVLPASSLPLLLSTTLAKSASPSATDEDDSAIAVISSSTSTVLPPLRPSLFIGDLRLTVLKERLRALGVPSEFAGEGVLVCGPAPPESYMTAGGRTIDVKMGAKATAEEAREAAGGKVAVKKVGRGRLVIEGSPGETYYVVRRVVYSLHASAG